MPDVLGPCEEPICCRVLVIAVLKDCIVTVLQTQMQSQNHAGKGFCGNPSETMTSSNSAEKRQNHYITQLIVITVY